MSQLALSASFEYLCYGSTAIIDILILKYLIFYTSESDVYRRQILMYKYGSRIERVNQEKGKWRNG